MKNLTKNDARKVDSKTLQYLRDRAIELREKGVSNLETAAILGVSRITTCKWYSKYKKDGKNSLKVQKTGRPVGSCRSLSPSQESMIIKLLIDKNPRQLSFKFALWTRESVRELILREIGIDMPISTVGKYLSQWQFTSKKPIKRAYERKDSTTKQWLENEYPQIKKDAKKQRADIWWCDETACQNLPNNLKGYAPIGKHNKPIQEYSAKKFKINMISAITNTGKSMFALYDESIASDNFIDFLQKAIDSNTTDFEIQTDKPNTTTPSTCKETIDNTTSVIDNIVQNNNKSKKIFMIVDNLRVHHAKKVKEWEENNKDKIKLFYLPAYSPEFNPDEYLNQDYKQSANKNDIPNDKEHLRKNTEKYMLSLQNNPQKVANFFKHPKVQYAS